MKNDRELERKRDELFTRLDGPLFVKQRACLLMAAEDRERNTDGEHELLMGLVEFTDAIADVAHDMYGIDCLLVEDDGEGGGPILDGTQGGSAMTGRECP